jgi:glycosyltransferase involved in cell wall biosynthesis
MKNTPPLVSVVVPCFKTTRYVTETLESLRAQTFRDFEAILVNDGCPDTENLEKVLEPYRDEIVYLKSGKWARVTTSRNTAMNWSRAKYIAFLDSDDAWEPDYLSYQVNILESDPTIDVVYPNATYFGEGSWVGDTFMNRIPSDGPVTVESILAGRCTVCISATSRRESLLQAGLMDPDLNGGEDMDLWFRVLQNGGKIVYHRRPLLRYRMRSGSLSDDKVTQLRDGLQVYEKHLNRPGLPEGQRELFAAAVRRQNALIDVFYGKKAVYARDRAEALTRLTQANRVLQNRRLGIAIFALRFAPGLLFDYIHRRYPTEYIFFH